MKLKTLKDHWEITLLLVIFLFTKLAFALKYHYIIWDEAVYIGMAKYLFSYGHTGLWEIIRPPGLPLLLGFIWSLTDNFVFYSELLINLFSAGSLLLIYFLAKDIHSKQAGIIAAFLLAITPVFFLYSGFILSGIPSTFFIILGIYLVSKKRFVAAGVSAALASQFRFPQGLFLVAVISALVCTHFFKKNKDLFDNLKHFVGAFILAHVPFFIFNLIKYYAVTSRLHHALFRPWLLAKTHAGNPAEALNLPILQQYAFYVVELVKSNFLLIFLVLGIIVFFYHKKYKDLTYNTMLLTLVFFLGYFSYIINKQVRFSLSFLFAMCFFAGIGLSQIYSYLTLKLKKVKPSTIFAVVLLVLFAFSYMYVIPEDEKYYHWRQDAHSNIVTEFYQYPVKNNIQSPILISDPIFAVYNDNYFIPIYFSLSVANQEYDQNKDIAKYLIYTNETFYCAPGDDYCRDQEEKFVSRIGENELVFNKSYGAEEWGFREYYIYKLT